ncbi:glycoside hydrolase family 108 protein [Ancylobacter sp.]|uniref:glycoside hydrolase family 108 protein n=1 Tax=Ancylobacter sp. TaxID=1872567 RepID=UPI003D09B311
MTAANFTRAQPHVLAYEGKFSNHPSDPGGRTYEGITQRVWDAWCALHGLPKRQLTAKTGTWKDWEKNRNAIYRKQYWDAVRADELPSGVDFAVYDLAVNSGVDRAVRILQKALRINNVDGSLGSVTMAAVERHPDHDLLVAAICAERLAFLQRLKTWKAFGTGWGRRVAAVRRTGQAWATGSIGPKAEPLDEPMAKAEDVDAKAIPTTAGADAAIGAGGSSVTAGGMLEGVRQQLEPYAYASDIIAKIVLALVIAGILAAAGGMAWRWHQKRRASEYAEVMA